MLATLPFVSESQLSSLILWQGRDQHTHTGSLQKTDIILEPVSSSRTQRDRQAEPFVIIQNPSILREVHGVPGSFCLQQVPAFMACNDLESCPHRESKSRNERIPEANAVYVLAASPQNKFTARLVP